jgi:hypothetical protein
LAGPLFPVISCISCGTHRLSLFSGGNIPNDGLKKLYLDELKDLYSAENQLVKALPKMAKAASSDELRKGFEQQLEQTKLTSSALNKSSAPWMKAQRARNA